MKQLMIGNAHLDPLWFWTWQEGYQEVKATFRSALDRMNETPGFVFTCACADNYRWVEENDPEMFEEIRRRVREGRWAVVGGMWIQPDMNIPDGESIARHLLYSQRYFSEHLGVTATVGYNVDTFGHNAMLPQLLKKAGIGAYVWMRPDIHENPDVPENAMEWESPDGTCIPAYRIHETYSRDDQLRADIDSMFDFAEAHGQPVMCFYGVGNHGGGPTIRNLNQIDEYKKTQPKGKDVEYASPVDYFQLLGESGLSLPHWKGELQHHASGCYSTHSASKMTHRRTENDLRRMEKMSCLSRMLTGHALNRVFVQQAWRNLMFCEFHDAMGGCSAKDVLENLVVTMHESCSIAAREENAALQKISWQVDTLRGLPREACTKTEHDQYWKTPMKGTPVVVFNPHEFAASSTIQIRRAAQKVMEDSGCVVASQLVRAGKTNNDEYQDTIFRAEVPPMGYRLYWFDEMPAENAVETPLRSSPTLLENDFIRAEFDEKTGALCKLIHKKSGINALSAPISVKLFDIEHCDTWAHAVFAFDRECSAFAFEKMRQVETGPVRAAIRVTLRHENSRIHLTYRLCPHSEQLEIAVSMDLAEHFRMVKLCVPTRWQDGKDVSEIPYGALTRTACGNEEPCQRWIAMQSGEGGLALINSGKYSYSAVNGELRMTLANTSLFADHFGQKHRDDLCRFMDQGEQDFVLAMVPYQGQWNGAKLHQKAALLNEDMPFVVETYHRGKLPAEMSALSVDNPAIRLGAFKRAEDENGYILRLSEAAGEGQNALLSLPLLNRMENLKFGAFEIKTLYVPDDPEKPIREVLLTETEKE